MVFETFWVKAIFEEGSEDVERFLDIYEIIKHKADSTKKDEFPTARSSF